MKAYIWRFAPLFIVKYLVGIFGSFRAREKLGLLKRPYYAYGLLSAADRAKKQGLKEIWALEFGVAAGRGLRILIDLAQQVEAVTGIKIKVAGFDTGAGMPISEDYRDHPHIYGEGDYPMVDQEKLRRDIGNDAELVIGNVEDTVSDFKNKLSPECPIGFCIIDVDVYTSTVDALELFNEDSTNYLYMTNFYFDDCSSRSHFTEFAGELLAIKEFNEAHMRKKLDIDRGVWNSHREIGPQLWYERMYILHCFDHPAMSPRVSEKKKILPEY